MRAHPLKHSRRVLRAAVVLGCCSTTFAADRTWLSTVGGTFNVASNWQGGLIPGASDSANFNLNQVNYSVHFTNSPTNTQLIVRNDSLAFLLNSQTYTLSSGGNGVILGNSANDIARLQLLGTGGVLSATNSALGNVANSTGFATISIGATWNSGNTNIGASGTGILHISASGDLIGAGAVGQAAGSVGTVSIDGSGSTWNGANATVGLAGTGTMIVTNAGSANFTFFNVGGLSGSKGSVHLNGALSDLDVSAGMNVGQAGAGTVVAGSSAFISPGTISIGSAAGGSGWVELNGFSSLSCATLLTVGGLSQGTLIQRQGSSSLAPQLIVGDGTTGTGSVLVAGAGALVDVGSGTAVIGKSGSGNVAVSDGAQLLSANLFLAQLPGSSAALTVGGSNARIQTGAMYVGGSTTLDGGSAVVTVNPHGSIQASGAMRLYSSGEVNLNGGRLSVASIELAGGSFDFNSGTLAVTGISGLTVGPSSPLGSTVTLDASRHLEVTNGLTVQDDGLLNFTGGSALAFAITVLNGGQLLLNSDTSIITASSLITNAGLISGNGRLSGPLLNGSSGEMRVSSGDQITAMNAGASTNSGLISLLGGELEVQGQLSNTSTGRIIGRGMLRVNSGIANAGSLTLSAGTSDVFGTITNNSGGKIIVTGTGVATFYDAITNNSGAEIRVSPQSTAVFFGQVTGPGSITGSGLKIFEFNGASIGGITTTGDTRVEPGATIVADFIREDSLSIGGAVVIRPNGSSFATSRLNALEIDGGASPTGSFDLNDNDLLINYDGTTTYPTVAAQIAYARNGGLWDQLGITSSAARNHSLGITTLGMIEGADWIAINGSDPFSGQPVDGTSLLIKYTYYGDSDLNGAVDFDDYVRIDSGFNSGAGGWINGDFDYNGTIDFDDYVLIDAAFNGQAGTLIDAMNWLEGEDRSASNAAIPGVRQVIEHYGLFGTEYTNAFYASVPEPCSAWLAVLSAVGLSGRRRRGT